MKSRKVPLLISLIIVLGLTACSPSWVIDPVTQYIQKKTGIAIKAQQFFIGLLPLHLEARGLQLNYNKGPASWDVGIEKISLAIAWSLSWENLPWPNFQLTKVSIHRPRLLIRLPETGQGTPWADWVNKFPAINDLEVNDLQGRLAIGKNTFQWAPGTRIKASFSPDQGGQIEYHLKNWHGYWASKKINVRVQAQGTLTLSDLQDRPQWQGSVTLIQGSLNSEAGKLSEVSGTFSGRYQNGHLEISTPAARLQEVRWLGKNFLVQGRGHIHGSGSFLKKPGTQEALIPEAILKFDELDFEFKKENQRIQGKTEGHVRISGPLSNPLIKGRLRAVQTDLAFDPVYTRGLETEIQIEGPVNHLSFPEVSAKAERTDWIRSSGPLPIIHPETRFSAQLNPANGQLELQNIDLKTDNWGHLSGRLLFDLSRGPAPSGRVRADRFPLPGFLDHFISKASAPFPGKPLCQGNLVWSRETAQSPIDFQMSIIPDPFALQKADSPWQGQGLKTLIEAQGKWFPKDKRVLFVINQDLSGGHFSRPPWAFDFDRYPLKAHFEGTLAGESQTGHLKGSLGLQSAPLGRLRISGEWPWAASPQNVSGTIDIQDLPLEKGFPLLVNPSPSPGHPFWDGVSWQGLINGRVFISKDNQAVRVNGRLKGAGLNLFSQEPPFSLQGLTLDIPFDLAWPGLPAGAKGPPEPGFIGADYFQGPQLSLKGLHVPLLVQPNQFAFSDKVQIPLWGGWVSINTLVLNNPLGHLKMEAALSIKDLAVGRLINKPDILGTVNGDLGSVRLDKEQAQIMGTLTARVFDGTITGGNWVVLQPFSPERRIQGDLIFGHLNLEDITRHFSFGKITGYVQGRVADLSISHNRPERFQLMVKTQEDPQVSKIINIKAIENINFLGTGWGDLDVLRQGVNRFIQEYRYREIGLTGSLKDDLLGLRGTIIEDGVEYVVRRPGLFGIDIINKNPDNEIQFSDLMNRLGRIGGNSQKGTEK